MTTTRIFTEAELDDIGPWNAVAMEPRDKHRWYTVTLMTFELEGQHWQVRYLDPASENQDGQDRYPDASKIVATLVHEVDETVKRWRPVPDDGASPVGSADAPTALDEIVHDVAKALGATPAEVDAAAARFAPAISRALRDATLGVTAGQELTPVTAVDLVKVADVMCRCAQAMNADTSMFASWHDGNGDCSAFEAAGPLEEVAEALAVPGPHMHEGCGELADAGQGPCLLPAPHGPVVLKPLGQGR